MYHISYAYEINGERFTDTCELHTSDEKFAYALAAIFIKGYTKHGGVILSWEVITK